MPVPSAISDLSPTPGSNSPAGSESPGLLDDYLRTLSAFIAQLRDGQGIVGGSRNVLMSIPAASATATLTASEIIVKTAVGGQSWLLTSVSKTINLATTGAGGMDTGTAPVSGWVAIYAIYNPASATSALLAKNATSGVQTEVYSGANMPAGYTGSALVAVLRTTAASLFAVQLLIDRFVHYNNAFFTGVASSFTAASLTAAVPPNARTLRCSVAVTSASVGQHNAMICTTISGSGFPGFSQVTGVTTAASQTIAGQFSDTPVFSQQVFVSVPTGATSSAVYSAYGYSF